MKSPYQIWKDEQEKKKKGLIPPSRSPINPNQIHYDRPNYTGSSEKKSYQWETDILKNLPKKRYGNTYDDKFNTMAKEQGLTPQQTKGFRTWLDAKEDGVRENKTIDNILTSLKRRNREDAERLKNAPKIVEQPKTKKSVLEERDGVLGVLDKTLGRASRAAHGVLPDWFEKQQQENYQQIAENKNDENLKKRMNTVYRPAKDGIEKAADITGTILGEIAPYTVGYGAADKVLKGAKALNTIKNPIAREFARGGIAGGVVGTGKAVSEDIGSKVSAKDYAKTIGIEAALGGATDAGLSAVFKGLAKLKNVNKSTQQPSKLNEQPKEFNPSLSLKSVFPEIKEPDPVIVEYLKSNNTVSSSNIQKLLKVDHTEASRIMDELEKRELIGPNVNNQPRTVNKDKLNLQFFSQKNNPMKLQIREPLTDIANAKSVPNDYDSVQHIDNMISREVKPSQKNSIAQRVKDFADRTYYNMFDDAYGLARLDKAIGKNVRDSDSAVATAHRSRGASAKAQQELEKGFYDKDGQKVGNSFTDILEKSKDPDKLETYLVAKGILDYDARGMVALKTDGLNQLELSNSATKQMELENPNIIQEAEQFYTYLKNQRNILKEGGIFNDAQIKQMEENNPNYVPMERVMDEGIENFVPSKEGLKKRFANVGNPIKKRTGSERQIISPFETTVKRQYVYNNMAERNKAGMAVLNHLRNMPEDNMFGNIVEMEENAALKVMKDADSIANQTDNEIPEKINDLFRAKEGDNNIIYVYENGNKYKIQIKDKMLFDSMMSLDSKSLPAWMNVVNLPVRMLRSGITLSPDFALRNFLRDQLTTGITSQKGYIPFYDAVLGASEIIKGKKGNSALINAYTRNGGDMSVLQNIDRANTIKTIRELKGNVPIMEKLRKLGKDPSLLLEPLRKIGEFSEMSTRIGHMKRSVKKGETMEQAAYNARSTMDFNRAGAWGRQINQMTAFFNASLQGLDVLARSFKDQPIKTARNIGMYIVAPTVALYHLNKDQQWYKDLPEEERDKNWFIKAGNEIIKIPKPFEAGVLFGASVERGLDKYYNNEGGEYEGYIEELAKMFVPELIPTAVKPLLEVYTNQNFFTGNAIDSMGDQMLPAKDRYNAYNSQFAIKTADILSKIKPNTEISPKDIDQLVRGYTGTLGTSANEGIDAILGSLNPNIPQKPNRGLQTMPFIRSLFVRNLEGNNKPTNDFYDKFDELRNMKKTQGDQFQYKAEKSVVEKTYKDISDLQRAKKEVLNSTTIDGKEKARLIKELNEQITEMARKVNEIPIGE